jgi:hypothetical protein
MLTHEERHRCHWTANEIGAAPVHEPTIADNTSPEIAVPVTRGGKLLTGAPLGPGRVTTAV